MVVVEISGDDGTVHSLSLLRVKDVLLAEDIGFQEEVDEEGEVRGVDEEAVPDHGLGHLTEVTGRLFLPRALQDVDPSHHLQDLHHGDGHGQTARWSDPQRLDRKVRVHDLRDRKSQ